MKLDVLIDALRRVGLAMDANGGKSDWITSNGAKIKLRDGESKADAIKRTNEKGKRDEARKEAADKARVEHMRGLVEKYNGDTREAAIDYYKNKLQGKKVKTKINGTDAEVSFAYHENNDFAVGMGNKDKCLFVPFIPEVISDGEYLGASDPVHNQTKYVAMHHFRKEINIDGIGKKKVLVDVGEDAQGKMEYRFYIFRAEVEKIYAQKEKKVLAGIEARKSKSKQSGSDAILWKASGDSLGQETTSANKLHSPTYTTLNADTKISNNDMVVNLFFENELEEVAPKKEIHLLVSALKKIAA